MKTVVVHRGARDGYQVARAMHEAGLLEALVTDMYWPADARWATVFERILPARMGTLVRRRWADGLPSRRVAVCMASGLYSLAVSKSKCTSFGWQRSAVRWADACLGRHAGCMATSTDAALLSYSYYGHSAFSSFRGDRPRILFQLHPHPARVREILSLERSRNPECASSLDREWEMALPEKDFQRLVNETTMAEYWLAASSFTRQTLVESGIPAERISVAPYGIDLQRFRPHPTVRRPNSSGRFRLLFVGTINQRKGIKYLLEALRLLREHRCELIVCGRPVDDLSLFKRYPQVDLRPSVNSADLLAAYQSSDLFVFPSLVEGFGHVLLEAMACGLPVLSTPHTAAPDLIRPGREGFIAPPASAESLAERIEWCMEHRIKVAEMGRAARQRAWTRFRQRIAETVTGILRQSRSMA
jgi:glycosyltransferase involved in cell wall biosynthesis